MGATSQVRSGAPMPEIALIAARAWSQVDLLGRQALLDAIGRADDDEVARYPAVLLHLARSCEAGLRSAQRTEALDRLDRVLVGDRRRGALGLEVLAERAIDEARAAHLDAAEALAREVLEETGTVDAPARHPGRGDPFVAAARATEALGRVLAWRGDRTSSHTAAGHLLDAAVRYRQLGSSEWEGAVRIWLGNAVHFQWGALDAAESAMTEGFAILDAASPRRALLLTFLADVLLTRGRTAEFDAVLAEALALATTQDDHAAFAYIAWSQARAASVGGNATTTVRLLLEVERYRNDWWDITSGPTFLADAAELLDRVGDHAAADAYVARALERAPDDEFVAQAVAVIAARRGDPDDAVRRLQRLAHAPWLEKRLVWRHTLFAAYATLRARRPAAAGVLAARALDEAAALGGPGVALAGEPEIVRILAPLAAAAGSLDAVRLLAPGGGVIVRLLGGVGVARLGETLVLPVGAGGALVRLLALHPAGLELDEVIDALWPEADAETGRRRLRDARFRLGARCGDLVERRGSRLVLSGAWVDAVAFRVAADRALAGGGDRTAAIAAALAVWSGDPLPTDLYADWAALPREQLRRRYLHVLDLAADEAMRAGRLDEAGVLLEEALEASPDEEERYLRLADHLTARDRAGEARRTLERGVAASRRLGLTPGRALLDRLGARGSPPVAGRRGEGIAPERAK